MPGHRGSGAGRHSPENSLGHLGMAAGPWHPGYLLILSVSKWLLPTTGWLKLLLWERADVTPAPASVGGERPSATAVLADSWERSEPLKSYVSAKDVNFVCSVSVRNIPSALSVKNTSFSFEFRAAGTLWFLSNHLIEMHLLELGKLLTSLLLQASERQILIWYSHALETEFAHLAMP